MEYGTLPAKPLRKKGRPTVGERSASGAVPMPAVEACGFHGVSAFGRLPLGLEICRAPHVAPCTAAFARTTALQWQENTSAVHALLKKTAPLPPSPPPPTLRLMFSSEKPLRDAERYSTSD